MCMYINIYLSYISIYCSIHITRKNFFVFELKTIMGHLNIVTGVLIVKLDEIYAAACWSQMFAS